MNGEMPAGIHDPLADVEDEIDRPDQGRALPFTFNLGERLWAIEVF